MATSKAHIEESQQGELQPTISEDVLSFTPPTMAQVEFKGEQEYVVFRLVKKKQRRLTLDGICRGVKNPTTKNIETIRLIRDAPSIWQSELTEFLKDKEHVSKNRIGLQFLDGVCRIGINETLKLDFARHNINNVGKNRGGSGKYDFYEYDAAEEQKMRHDKQMSRINTIQFVSTMEEKPMIELALFLGIKPIDEEVGMQKTPSGFRADLLMLADTKPDLVNKYQGQAEVKISYLVRRAIIDTKIDLGGQTGNVIWAGGGGFIAKIPQNRKALEYLTELAMTNSPEGKKFKEQLEQMIT